MKNTRTTTTPNDRPGPLLIYEIGGKLVAKRSSPSPQVRHPAAVTEAARQQIQESLYAALNEGMTEEEAHAQQARNSKDLQQRMASSFTPKRSQK
jgi:hypothetical protein